MEKGKWLSQEALQAEKRRQVKAKEKRKDYPSEQSSKEQQGEIRKPSTVTNANKQRKKKKRIGKTRDLFKKIRDTKRTFHGKMGTIKDRNGMDLTEAEDIKKRWQKKQNYTKKILMTQTTTMV